MPGIPSTQPKPIRILDINRSGKVWVYLEDLAATAAFADQALQDEVLRRFRSIPGIHLSRAEKYPGFPLDDLAQSDTWAGFQDVVSGILERLRAVVT